MEYPYTVDIREFGTGKVVRSIPTKSKRQAEKVESGVNINLNHTEFYTHVRYRGLEEERAVIYA